MDNKRIQKYDQLISELLALYEISSIPFLYSEESLVEEVREKAVRLFGVRYFALSIGPKDHRRLAKSFGFRNLEEISEKVKQNKSNQFYSPFGNRGELGELFMEQCPPISNRERRLYTVFAHYIKKSLSFIRDIEKLKRVKKEHEFLLRSQREQHLQIETLAKLILTLNTKINLLEILDEVLYQAKRIIPYISANIALLEGNDIHIIRRQGYQKFGIEDFISKFVIKLDKFPLTEELVKTKKPLFIPDTYKDPRWVVVKETNWIRSHITIPVCLYENVLGLLMIDSDTPNKFSVEDIKRLQPLANTAAIALKEAREYRKTEQVEEELKQSYKKLKKILEGVVQAVALTVDIRDPYTAGHQRRVSQLSSVIAKEMNLTLDQIEEIHIAGVLHDIGKISVPTEILTKPGRLNDMEMSLLKAHPQVGYDILEKIDFPWPLAQIVLQHHERMDGSGYPVGLSGKEILLEARILGVADVVEAMSSHRPYRPALGVNKALEEISKNRGILYDPGVVDACVKLFKEKGFKFE